MLIQEVAGGRGGAGVRSGGLWGKRFPVFSWPLDNQASLELILGESYNDFPQNEPPGKQGQTW